MKSSRATRGERVPQRDSSASSDTDGGSPKEHLFKDAYLLYGNKFVLARVEGFVHLRWLGLGGARGSVCWDWEAAGGAAAAA